MLFFTFGTMGDFVVSALKYRPQVFEDVVGQQSITQTLENAIEKNQLPQALLFCGPRGVGKTTCARILAKKLNTPKGETLDPAQDYAFNIFELDAASNNSVEDIRSLNEQVRITPQVGQFKIFIIDEVHMLSIQAFNAFLKTLEEPPKHAVFILATTEKHKIIPTILSRCQVFDFKRITVSDIEKHLAKIAQDKGIIFDSQALRIIADKADGALRDALSIFDRMANFCDNELTVARVSENLRILDYSTYIQLTEKILENNIPEVLTTYDGILQKGFEGANFINGLSSHFRNLMLSKDPRTLPILEMNDEMQTQYLAQAEAILPQLLIQAIDLCNDCELQYKASQNKRLHIELCLMQLCSLHTDGEKKKG